MIFDFNNDNDISDEGYQKALGKGKELKLKKKELQNLLRYYELQLSQLDQSINSLDRMDGKNEAIKIYIIGLKKISVISKNTYKELSDYLKEITLELKEDDILKEKIDFLHNEYLELKNHSFTETFDIVTTGDQIDLTVNIKDGTNVFKTQIIPIPVFGGIKINSSIGIGFGNFFNPPKIYFTFSCEKSVIIFFV